MLNKEVKNNSMLLVDMSLPAFIIGRNQCQIAKETAAPQLRQYGSQFIIFHIDLPLC